MRIPVRLHVIKAFLIKEFRQLFRDRKMRLVIFAPPIVMMFVFGYSVNMDVNNVRMALMDCDRTGMSREFAQKFTSCGYFTMEKHITKQSDIDVSLDSGEVEFALVIEKNFEKKIQRGETAHILTLIDGTDSNRAGIIVSYINQITMEYSQKLLRGKVAAVVAGRGLPFSPRVREIAVEERTLFNQELASRNFFLPGVLVLLLGLVTVLLTAMSVVKEREVGTIEQIVVSPIRPMEYIAGKMLPFACVACIDIFIISAIITLWFSVPFNGSVLVLLAGGAAFIFASSSMGLFISTVSKTQQQAMLSTFLFFLPAILFSGFVFPIYSMPEVVQYVTYLNPFRYFIDIVRGVFLKGIGFALLWRDMVLLIMIGLALFYLSASRFSRGME
jgi:ABC-2 type transport system permease protein